MPSAASFPTTAFLIAAAAACLASCEGREEEPGTPPPAVTSPAPAPAPRSDHKNTEYSIAGRTIWLVDGVAEVAAAPGSAARVVTRYFGNEVFGDLNGDGREDVLFLLTQETGGSGTFFYAVAALNLERGYAGSEGLLLGDRIAPQTTTLRPDGVVVVNYADRAPGESFATAPSVGKTLWLKLNPATLQLGEVVQDFEGEADPDSMELGMKTWVWIRAVDGGNEIVPRQADAFTLTFEGSTFSATTDCNRVRGGYTTQERELTFADNMAATRMFCADSQENVFTQLLARTASYAFTSRGELVLEFAGDTGSMTFR
jgi:heat shock protein HslJ